MGNKGAKAAMKAGKLSEAEVKRGTEKKAADGSVDISAAGGNGKISMEDFDLIKVLGKGSFGKVMLVRHKGNQKTYAMKTLRKAQLVKRNQLAHTRTERSILQNFSNPFLVKMAFAFQTPDKLYMVLEYMGGGELFFWLKKDRKFELSRARLYAAEITLALEALHNADIIYRDLKPENILLGLDGHLKLTDFGLSKETVTGAGAEGGTLTFCGTPEYLAPEILQNKGHGKAVDWWSLGTLLFEMMAGLPPFYDANMQKMYDKILYGKINYPKTMNDAAKSILSQLLDREVQARLGSGPTDSNEIKSHPFFETINWEKVMNLEYEPEFKPPAKKDDTDVSNFDKEFTNERVEDSMVTPNQALSESKKEKTKFDAFTYQENSNMGS